MAFASLQRNASFDQDFCPINSNETCKLTQVCCPNKTACCPDELLTQNTIALFAIITVLMIIDVLVGYKVYQRWKGKQEAKERAEMSIEGAKKKKKTLKDNHFGSICLKEIKEMIQPGESQTIS